jgi:hypothetical protein
MVLYRYRLRQRFCYLLPRIATGRHKRVAQENTEGSEMNMTDCRYTMSNLELQIAINDARCWLLQVQAQVWRDSNPILQEAREQLSQLMAEQAKRSRDAVVKND